MAKTITFIKDHPAGIKAGRTHKFSDKVANLHIVEGFAVEAEGAAPVVVINESETIEIVVTKEDLKANPSLKAEGVKVGDTINIENPNFVKQQEEDIQL